jgi:ATP-dependent protease ClpP protease subunit
MAMISVPIKVKSVEDHAAMRMHYCFRNPMQRADGENNKLYELYIYDEITKYGNFDWETWSYKESETSANYFREQLAKIPEDAHINLYINSAGGYASEGTAIYNQLVRHPAKKTGYVDGICYSAAFLILQACDERVMGQGTSALAHNMWECVSGNAAQLRKAADDLDALMESNRQLFLKASGGKISEKQLRKIMDDEKILSPEDCVTYGLADRIADRSDTNSSGSLGGDGGEGGNAAGGAGDAALQSARLNAMQEYINKHNLMVEQIKQLREVNGGVWHPAESEIRLTGGDGYTFRADGIDGTIKGGKINFTFDKNGLSGTIAMDKNDIAKNGTGGEAAGALGSANDGKGGGDAADVVEKGAGASEALAAFLNIFNN